MGRIVLLSEGIGQPCCLVMVASGGAAWLVAWLNMAAPPIASGKGERGHRAVVGR